MRMDATFEANAQLAEGGDPGVGSLDDPAMTAQAIIAFDAFSRDPHLDATTPQMRSAALVVIALVGMKPIRPAARLADAPWHRWQSIDQVFEDDRIVPVCSGHAKHHRDAVAIRDDVAFAAEFAAVGRVGTCELAPRGLATLAPSTLALLKSSWPAALNCANSSRCKRCHTPAVCHSRSRRQHVMPLPNPNSWGRSSQAMPVRKTKRIPLSACWSPTLGRPPLSRGFASGSKGSIFFHSSALIALDFFMRRQTHVLRFSMTPFC
jgi:hypothetical protein